MSTAAMIPSTDLKCTVVSLVPFEIKEHKPGLIPPFYTIKASDGKTPTLKTVGTAIHYVYLDETRGNLPVRQPSNEVARSIVQDFLDGQLQTQQNARPGIFWLPGVVNLDTVLKEYKSRLAEEAIFQRNWFINLVKLADDDWTRYKVNSVISDFQRTAAMMLGLRPEEHAWMAPRTTLSSASCPACHTLVEPGLAICPQCNCILDEEKFKTLKFVPR